jgi:hypothetical protein
MFGLLAEQTEGLNGPLAEERGDRSIEPRLEMSF